MIKQELYVPAPFYIAKPYTQDEDDVIREHYPNGGSAAVLKHLTHRKRASINYRARVLGIKAGGVMIVQSTALFPTRFRRRGT